MQQLNSILLPIIFIAFLLISVGAYTVMHSKGIGYYIRVIVASIVFSIVISFIVNIIVFEHKKNVCVERMFEDLN
jgi:hypothetical protein